MNDWLSLIAENLTNQTTPIQQNDKQSLENLIDGEYVEVEGALIFTRELRYPLGDLLEEVEWLAIPSTLRKYARILQTGAISPSHLLLVDTETTGLMGGTGTIPFLIGIGIVKENELIVKQYFLEDLASEAKMLALFLQHIADSTVFLSYNGRSFDIPLLQNRLLLNRYSEDIRMKSHLDLLPLARRLWKTMMDSYSLSSVEYHVLHKMRECEEDIAGCMIPQVYQNYQASGDPTELVPVIQHNRDDIVSLFQLYGYVCKVFHNIRALDTISWLNQYEVGRVLEQVLEYDKAIDVYEKCYGQKQSAEVALSLANLYKKKGNWRRAKELWQQNQTEDALLELAKMAEHRERDYEQAIRYTDQLAQLYQASSIWNNKLSSELQKRKERLFAKL